MIDFRVVPDDGEPYEVKATTRDVLVWERSTKGRSFMSLQEDLRIQDMYHLAHIASRRNGLFNGSLKDFEETCELSFEEMEEPDPTPPARSTEPASPSPSQLAYLPRNGQRKGNGR